jgi:calcium/calmodulin-dependent protein kinase kinase 2
VQSSLLRHGGLRRPGPFPPRGFNRPLSPSVLAGGAGEGPGDALFLIREEIAIMKKLHHQNLVQLIEVLDDPDEDSLYMVLEMCQRGVVMKVGLDETANPYDEEACWRYFRDLIMGIEYCESASLVISASKARPAGSWTEEVRRVGRTRLTHGFSHGSTPTGHRSPGHQAGQPAAHERRHTQDC